LHERGVPYAEMMILYASRKYGGLPEQDLPLFILDRLEENGIMACWPARNAQSKAAWDITTDSVAVSTIHSMKGLDAETVFVFGLDELERKQSSSDARSLAYVACTRARNHLEILYCEETPLIAAIRQAIP
jgi:superfamily I DNA/RNA helicase